MIYCPKCNSETQVVDTRASFGHARRRRICKSTSCGMRVSTLEMVITAGASVTPGSTIIADTLSGMVVVPRRKLESLRRLIDAIAPASKPETDKEA